MALTPKSNPYTKTYTTGIGSNYSVPTNNSLLVESLKVKQEKVTPKITDVFNQKGELILPPSPTNYAGSTISKASFTPLNVNAKDIAEINDINEAYFRQKRKEENIKLYREQNPDKAFNEEYIAPTTLKGKFFESGEILSNTINTTYNQFIKPTIGTLLETFAPTGELRAMGEKFADTSVYEFSRSETAQSMADSFSDANGWTDIRAYAHTVSNAVGIMGTIVGTGIVSTVFSGGDPVVGLLATNAAMTAIEGSSQYQNLIDKGVAPDKAKAPALLYGLVAAKIENMFGIKPNQLTNTALEKGLVSVISKMAESPLFNVIIGEGTEELLQQFTQNAITKSLVEDQDLTENLVDSFIGGAVGGAAMGGGSQILNYRGKKAEEKKIKEEEAKKSLEGTEGVKYSENTIYRYGDPRAKPMSDSTFYTPDRGAVEEYNLNGNAILYEKVIIDDSRIYNGSSTFQYATDNKLMDEPMSLDLQELTGLKTLRDVSEEYAWGVTEKSSKAYQENPNIYYTAFQQTVARELKKKGYAGAYWVVEDELTPKQYQIWDQSILRDKTKPQFKPFIPTGQRIRNEEQEGSVKFKEKESAPTIGDTEYYRMQNKAMNNLIKDEVGRIVPLDTVDWENLQGHYEYGSPLTDKTYRWLDRYIRGLPIQNINDDIAIELGYFVPDRPIRVYRGGKTNTNVGGVKVNSWTTDLSVAKSFAGKDGKIYEALVEPKDIIFDSNMVNPNWDIPVFSDESEVIVSSRVRGSEINKSPSFKPFIPNGKNVRTEEQSVDIDNAISYAKVGKGGFNPGEVYLVDNGIGYPVPMLITNNRGNGRVDGVFLADVIEGKQLASIRDSVIDVSQNRLMTLSNQSQKSLEDYIKDVLGVDHKIEPINYIKKESAQKRLFKTGYIGQSSFRLTPEMAKEWAYQLFNEDEIKFIFSDVPLTTQNGFAWGSSFENMVTLVLKNGNVSDLVLYHEAFHNYFNQFASYLDRRETLDFVKQKQGIDNDLQAEEWLADNFAKYVKDNTVPEGIIARTFRRILNQIKRWIGRLDKAQVMFEDVILKRRAIRPQRYSSSFDRDIPDLAIEKYNTALSLIEDNFRVESMTIDELIGMINDFNLPEIDKMILKESVVDFAVANNNSQDEKIYFSQYYNFIKNSLLPLKYKEKKGMVDKLSTTLLEKYLKGRTSVSRQFIEDLAGIKDGKLVEGYTRDLKKPERETILSVLEEMEESTDYVDIKKLVEEAKKYKSVDEFIKAQGTPIYRGQDSAKFSMEGKSAGIGKSFTTDKKIAEVYGSKGKIIDGFIDNKDVLRYNELDSKTKQYIKSIIDERIDRVKIGLENENIKPFEELVLELGEIARIKNKKAIDISSFGIPSESEIRILSKDAIKTKSQLTDIWNKANQKSKIDVKDFSERVKKELLPLSFQMSTPRYGHIVLEVQEKRGNVVNYEEHIWESPIENSSGRIHFETAAAYFPSKYFGHVRLEDMSKINTADYRPVFNRDDDMWELREKWNGDPLESQYSGELVPMQFNTKKEATNALKSSIYFNTRRIIEVQSDLYQMGRLEREIKNAEAYDDLLKRGVVKKKLDQANRKQIGKLQQYNDPTAHFRMVREEVKIAAEDGIEKLQFPTGRTAMEIEGLGGEPAEWWLIPEGGESNRPMWGNPNSKKITPENLEVGQKINRDGWGTDDWIITDVLGDGKFKAVPKDFEEQIKRFEEASVRRLEQGIDTPEQQARLRAQLAPREETFDISGKIDESNPIYIFYEKTLGKYLEKMYNAKRITDTKNVEWYEIDIEPAFANQPVLAFKMAEDDDSELSNEEARALYEQIAKEEMKYNRDAIDDIIDGKRKILPPTELKSDWMETIGKSAYARIFNKNSLIRADEIASDLGMTEDDLKEEIAKRLRHRELEKEKDKAMDESLKDWAKKELKLFSKDDSYKSISQELKDKIKVFFRPSRKRVSRTFSLLGNKDTTVPLFSHIFNEWTRSGVEQIIEPYAGAFTLGTHSIREAIKSGLKRFDSNIFDEEKYIIIKAIQDGRVDEVKSELSIAVSRLNAEMIKQSKGNKLVEPVINEFINLYPESYIGSKQWLSFIREKPVGKNVTVYKDEYNAFREVFQKAYDVLFKEKIVDLPSAMMISVIKRTGLFGGSGQGLLNTNGFVPFEDKLMNDKYGMIAGIEDTNKTFELAEKHGTEIVLYNMDGADFIDAMSKQIEDPKKVGIYMDPPYVKSSYVYAQQSDDNALDKFTSGKSFYESHKPAFDIVANGAKIALTNDVDEEYLDSMIEGVPEAQLFAYKEGNTPTSLVVSRETGSIIDTFLSSVEKTVSGEREEVARIKEIKAEKGLSSLTVSRIRKGLGIKEFKNATPEKLAEMIDFLDGMEYGDSLLTELQLAGFGRIIPFGKYKYPNLVIKREFIEEFGEKTDIFEGRIERSALKELFPSVDIKEGHPMLERTVNRADWALRKANKKTEERSKRIDEMMKRVEIENKKAGRNNEEANKRIFRMMSGETLKDSTPGERAVVAYLKNFFNKVKEDFDLKKYRRHYIPHLDRSLMEKIKEDGVLGAIRSYLDPKKSDIPIDVMVALDDIIGSEKFFRFALERKGGMKPTNNIRRIVNEYSSVVETKKALDYILPEAQAVQQLLLQGESTLWMKKFLQNLKGRGLDSSFRNGPMGWMAKMGDRIIDIGYVRLLGLNLWSVVKNIMGGETNSFIFQGFDKYLKGKQRLMVHPKESIGFIADSGVLDGSYAEYARSTTIEKGKRIADLILYGGMELAEYEIRGSLLLGELTDEEWNNVLSGKKEPISRNRFREILDIIAITQGIYTKVDSPLFAQTWYGRAMLQFNRWRITNAMLFKRIVMGAKKEFENKNYTGVNGRRMAKMLLVYGIMMFLAFELGKRGEEKWKKVAEAGAEVINSTFEILTGKAVYDAIRNNPSLEFLESIYYTIEILAAYITGGEEPSNLEFKRSILETYVAGLRTLGIQKDSKDDEEFDWDQVFNGTGGEEDFDWDEVFDNQSGEDEFDWDEVFGK